MNPYFFEYGSYSSSFPEVAKSEVPDTFVPVSDDFFLLLYFWYRRIAANAATEAIIMI